MNSSTQEVTLQLSQISQAWGPALNATTGGTKGLVATFQVNQPLDEAFKAIGANLSVSVTSPARVGGPMVVPLFVGTFKDGVGFFAKCEAHQGGHSVEMQLYAPSEPGAGASPDALFAVADEILSKAAAKPLDGLIGYLSHRMHHKALDKAGRKRLLTEMAAMISELIAAN